MTYEDGGGGNSQDAPHGKGLESMEPVGLRLGARFVTEPRQEKVDGKN